MLAESKFESEWYSKPGVVYFIAAGSPPVAIKIGVTQRAKLPQRLRQIQSSNHETISLLGTITFDGDEKPLLRAERKERDLHRQFAKYQKIADGKVGHEWFSAGPELLDYIAALSANLSEASGIAFTEGPVSV